MTSKHLPLTFYLDRECTLDTIEAVLAIARRGGLRLANLTLREEDASSRVCLEVVAEDPDRLDLFIARLGNLFGVHGVEAYACCTMHKNS